MESFTHHYVTDRIVRIVDATQTALYLVLGDERAMLVDTGSGIAPLRPYAESISDLPYDVLLTHGHVDHASGAGEFADKRIYLHPADRKLMSYHTSFGNRLDYLWHTAGLAVPEGQLTAMMDPGKTLPLADGQRFDLGGLHLEAIHVPGHTHGMCMVLIEEERFILFGDGCGVSVMIVDDEATSVEEYSQALRRLKQHEARYDHVIRNHGTCVSPKVLLDNVIACCDDVLAGCDDRMPAPPCSLPVPCDGIAFAREIDPVGRRRIDGKEGNLAYLSSKVYAPKL